MWLRFVKPFSPLGKSPKHPWLLSSLSSYSDATHVKEKAAPLQETRMKDRFKIHVKGGYGGSGCFSVRRSRHDRRGKPDGGNGGWGGDVVLECSPGVWDFSGLHHHINATRGGHGGSKNMIGTRGDDKIVPVPIGTVIHLVEGELPSAVEKISTTGLDPWDLPGTVDGDQFQSHQQYTFNVSTVEDQEGEVLDYAGGSEYLDQVEVESMQAAEGEVLDYAGDSEDVDQIEFESMQATEDESEDVDQIQYNVAELTELGQRILVARGGEGGLGNVSFSNAFMKRKPGKHGNSKNNGCDPETRNADESSPSAGLPGSEAILVLELKSIADVGLVGMPNAGKSTLLGALSRAKPTVGHYEFTTLRPNLGKVNFDYFSVTVADIPGLIKGAHENRGLGHAFLRHIERTKVLAYVLDLAAALDHRKGLPPWEQLKDLVLELEHHQEGLSNRPSLVVANKIDEAGAYQVYEELTRRVKDVPIYPVCAVLEEGVPELKVGLRVLVDGGKSQGLSLDKIDCSL